MFASSAGAAVLAMLLFAGAGCAAPKRAVIATRAMMPADFTIMPGLEPADEPSWRITGTETHPRIDTHWQTSALFDKVEAYYTDFIGKNWGLATHVVEDKEGVRIFWGLADDVRTADTRGNPQFIAISKARAAGKTTVEIMISPRTP
ncbi:MAG: hypothetical protein RL272_437 [Candidatus Parcubacteria bacterium]